MLLTMAGRMGGSEDILDQQNRMMTDFLSQKVSRLKSLAFDIETETKDHTRLLNSLDNDFDSGHGFLSGSMNRVNKMIGRGKSNRKIMCYVTFGLVALFFLSYYVLRHIY